jgi:hypothetical protein
MRSVALFRDAAHGAHQLSLDSKLLANGGLGLEFPDTA